MKILKTFESFNENPITKTLINKFGLDEEDANNLSELHDEIVSSDDMDERMDIVDNHLFDHEYEDKYDDVWEDLEEFIKDWTIM
jgi:hypothetical protein